MSIIFKTYPPNHAGGPSVIAVPGGIEAYRGSRLNPKLDGITTEFDCAAAAGATIVAFHAKSSAERTS